MALPVPNIPVVNLGNLYVQGLHMSFVTGGLLLNIAAGQARDGTNTNDIVLPANAQINTALSGVVNGLDTGALAANTLYAVYVVGSSNSNGPVGCMMSTNFTSPYLPSGYDMVRYIGSVLTTAGSLIADFTQGGLSSSRTVWYAEVIPTTVAPGNSTTFATFSVAAGVPKSAAAAMFEAIFTSDGGGDRWYGLRATGSTSSIGQVFGSATLGSISHTSPTCPVGLNAGVVSADYRVNNALASLILNVIGYVDQL